MSDVDMERTLIVNLGEYKGNHLWMKREDLIPFSFGGNKARKAMQFFREIDKGRYDCVVTYGSSSSNHCRVVSNLCVARQIPCYIISPQEASENTFNKVMMEIFGAEITVVPVGDVHDAIEGKLCELRKSGKNPYFIAGGGHGNIGTQAYVNCYQEILQYEKTSGIHFDYIFHASGTGTTQAGLVCGQLLNKSDRTIIGISIARKNPRGRDVVVDSIREYIGDRADEESIQRTTVFIDDYIGEGYGKSSQQIKDTINSMMKNYGIPLDATYTGKAFMGMQEYIKKKRIEGNKILFIHTGGTPLFFDTLGRIQ